MNKFVSQVDYLKAEKEKKKLDEIRLDKQRPRPWTDDRTKHDDISAESQKLIDAFLNRHDKQND